MTNSKQLLLIFTRNPEIGKCKTRLAAKIGEKAALEVYKFLLDHTVHITEHLKVDKRVYYSETIWDNDIWSKNLYDKKLQQGDDLGARMLAAFNDGFAAGYKSIIVIGSDMYDLSEEDLIHAFEALKSDNFVVGPAADGGYYLLGMNKLCKALFKNKAWGKNTVLAATLDDLKNQRYSLLETRNDIDVLEDIKDQQVFLPFIKHLKNE